MPFGIQTKGLIVGVVIGAIVYPRVMMMIASRSK